MRLTVAQLERERERNQFSVGESEGDGVCGVEDLPKWHDGDWVAELQRSGREIPRRNDVRRCSFGGLLRGCMADPSDGGVVRLYSRRRLVSAAVLQVAG